MGSRDDRNINRVSFKNNDMEAYLYLSNPPDDHEYDIEEILGFLRAQGVTNGVNRSRVSAMIKKKIYNREQLVAEGQQPEDGVDGYYEFFFDATGDGKKHPKINDDGTVDYTSVNVIECVLPGDKLALYHPAVKEVSGLSVRGKPVPGKRAKELPPLRTQNCEFNPEEQTYYASIEGRVEASKAKLSVSGIQEFKKDIDLVFGNVNFNGDVIIHGNVDEGVHISATRSVTIEGVFRGASLGAGEDIVVKGGVLGTEGSKIVCGGEFMADFIQYADVEAVGDVSANYILDSRIVSKSMVRVSGEKGSIVGGNVYGMQGVEARFIGNDVFLRTIVAAGVMDNVAQNRKELAKEEKHLNDRFQEMKLRSDELERKVRLGTADEGMLQERQNLMREKIEKKAQLQEIQRKAAEFDAIIKNAEGAVVRAFDTAYEGVMVLIDSQQYGLSENKRAVEFAINEESELLLPRPVTGA